MKKFLNEIFIQRGFDGAGDYFATVFGLKDLPFFKLQIIAIAASSFVSFVTDWVWNPPGAVGLLIGMDLINAYYGYKANKHIRSEGFDFKKFQKTWSIVASDIISCAMLHIAIKYYPYYAPLSHVLFAWLFAYKIRGVFTHFTLLGLQDGSLSGVLFTALKNLLRSQYGAALIDEIQEPKKEEDETKIPSE